MIKFYTKKLAPLAICCCLLSACASNSGDMGMYSAENAGPNVRAAADNIRLSMAYLQEGRSTVAKQKILLAQKEAPRWPPVLDGLAYYYAQTGDPQKADTYYQEAIRLDGHAGSLQNNYGTFLCTQGKYKQAVKRFLMAVEDPKYISTAAAYENAGLCATKIPDNKAAIAYFTKALEISPLRATSAFELAQLYYQQKKYQQANVLFSRYQDTQPASAASLWLSVRLARKLHKMDLAASQALLLKEKYPDSAETKKLLATEKS